MSAAELLRTLLDVRGVEHTDIGGMTEWTNGGGRMCRAYTRTESTFVDVVMYAMPPQQAIAATLGDVPCLPYFWTADETLHVELPRLPESISVRLPDQRDREVGSARTWQYTQGSGTCRYEIAFFGDGKAWFACSECGGMASADYDPPKYCPHCGRKVVDE